MLKELNIKNLILVKEASISFRKGLNVVTGETGAGKSVIIGSLKLIFGERANSDIIRRGEQRCVVEAVLDVTGNKSVLDIVEDMGIEVEDNLLVIRRIINLDGNNRQFINSCSVPLSVLKNIAGNMIDIHGRHEHQSLFNLEMHRTFLDWFAGLATVVEDYNNDFVEYQKLLTKIKSIEDKIKDNEREKQLWEYELNEIESVQIEPDEDDTLEREYSVASNATEIKSKCFEFYESLYGKDNSVYDSVSVLSRLLTELAKLDDFFGSKLDSLDDANATIEALASEVRQRGENIDTDSDRIVQMESRIALFEKLKHKFARSIPEILDYAEELKLKINDQEQIGEELLELKHCKGTLYTRLVDKSKKINVSRKKRAPDLCSKIESELKKLGMPESKINIRIDISETPVLSACDSVEFMFAANRGESWSALRKTASSGEISRLMLALKSTFASVDSIGVMVFDEIDVNIGGTTARDVGRRLRALSEKHQVLCITHLHQIAGFGNAHYKVEKSVVGDRTFAEITELDINERIEEIARMLGGQNLTSVTLVHAKELIENN